ncbi:MAG: septal ring lytic transglycosylase RlpA family protein [Treponema sp.]|nr:septal ring lytic transglycosylase RlpA family protein [Treponema sp.]
MKRISLALLIGLLFNTMAMAQVSGFEQRGRATQELRAEGMSIAHPSLPLNSRVRVVNTVSGREVEATVTGRIPASGARIADLSAGVWQDLGLSPDTDIRIYTAPPARPRPPAAVAEAPPPAPPPAPAPTPAPAAPEPRPAIPEPVQAQATAEPGQPLNITLHAYLVQPESVPAAEAAPPPEQTAQVAEAAPPPEQTAQVQSRVEPANPELNWLAWLSFMTAESRGRDMVTLPYSQQQQVFPPQVQQAPPQVQYVQPPTQQAQPPQVQYVQPPAQQPPQVHYIQPPAQQEPQVHFIQPPAQQPPQVHFIQPPAQQEPQVHFIQPPAQQPPQVHIIQPPAQQQTNVQVIPGLPDPDSGRTFRLQVGSFTSPDTAAIVASRVRAAGFNVIQEQSPPHYRVVATDIPAAMVESAVQRLGAIGVTQIWVRE